jgi:hypothetical protein
MSFLRRRRFTLLVVALQVSFFLYVGISEHRRTAFEYDLKKNPKLTVLADLEGFGCFGLHRTPYAAERDEGNGWNMAEIDCWNPPLVSLVEVINLPVFVLTAFAVTELRPYLSPLILFYTMMTIGIALYWYVIGTAIDRLLRRRREKKQLI